MDFQCVAFLPSQASFSSYFLKIVVEVKALETPHVLQLWVEVSLGDTTCPTAVGGGKPWRHHMSYSCGWR